MAIRSATLRDLRDPPVTIRACLPRDLEAVGTARGLVDRLAASRLPEDDRLDALLLVTEVVTNSVLHAAGDRIVIAAAVDDARLTVEVADGGPGLRLDGDAPMPSPAAVHGRGLGLLARIAHRWGYGHRPSRVWFELVGAAPA